jgi:DNA polymerase-3 subunit delta'
MLKTNEFIKLQSVPFQVVNNSFKIQAFNHAYLIEGGHGTPLLEFAQFVAKAILCQGEECVCDECYACKHMNSGTYPDFLYIDAEKNVIIKEDILNIQRIYSLQAQDEIGKKVYLIHHFENLTPLLLNSLLKFIEDPVDNVYAVFTTSSLDKLLPTIISRCQVLHLQDLTSKQLYEKLLSEDMLPEDAYLLSRISSSYENAITLKEDETVQSLNNLVFELIHLLSEDDKCIYYLQTYGYTIITSTQECRIFLNILCIVIQDINSARKGLEVHFKNLEKITFDLALRINNIDNVLSRVLLTSSYLAFNANYYLLLDSLFYFLKGAFNA